MWWSNKEGIKKLTEKVADYASGNMSEILKPEEYPREIRELASYIAELSETVRQFTKETQVSSSKVVAAVQQVNNAIVNSSDLSKDINSKAEHTKKMTQDIVAAIEQANEQSSEVSAASERITSIATDIYQDSIDTSTYAKHGSTAVAEATSAMEDIEESSQEIQERIRHLTQMTKEIDSFLAAIQGVSVQTNLLALNASIEAARAGEHGRGFAVVAQEIQKLSSDSAAAANSANSLLVQINTGVSEAAKASEHGAKAVEIGTMATATAEENLATILKASASMEKKLSEASEARQLQYEANQKISQFLEDMVSMCVETSNQVEGVTDALIEQEKHLVETQDMGDILSEVANQLVNTTSKITLLDMTDAKKQEVDYKIQKLCKVIQDTAKSSMILTMNADEHMQQLEGLIKREKDLEAAWTNKLNGEFVISLPPAGIANASDRDWFKEARKGEVYVSPIYVSAISYRPCITISMPILADNKKIIGVIGIDVKISDN
ncbi:methyl-accepting chemotaxis protein [Desulfuribacillus alkaliarsenatis]|uniref:Methyl-accepting transducer domain-containing protein n=1 Tax=Desulfuribacillus alkaliarsenatis TaxID=766136 RepID=A0A1E5G4G8_9FIRM|nr:methyl-accepting chemotaxis protein [Desulfuribacillus alkaliarsenatis]OEF97981.1 hypothetical protein BHF68_13005 [Desulfuribacillus alkaliarsenatis]